MTSSARTTCTCFGYWSRLRSAWYLHGHPGRHVIGQRQRLQALLGVGVGGPGISDDVENVGAGRSRRIRAVSTPMIGL